MRRIHIFRAGRHTPMQGGPLEFSAADLAATAAAYDPARHEAPIVVGHPTTDAPAYGWVGGLAAEAGGLYATPRQVEPAFAAMVREGRFRKVSASFYAPQHPQNPAPGAWYLKHVGFLGAVAPAVKGLKPIEFAADDDQVVTVEFGDPAARGADEPPAPTPPPSKGNARVTEEELAARERAIAEREAAFAERETGRRRAEDQAFVDGLVAEARLPQGLAPRAVAFMASLGDAGEVSFSEAGRPVKEAPHAAFRALLAALPKIVTFGEAAGGAGPGAGDPPMTAEFAGHRVDPERLALHHKALAYQRAHPNTDYLAAVTAVDQAG